MKRTVSIAAILLACVTAAGSASAAVPSADGVISACKSKDGGIKLIDLEAGQTCSDRQVLVEWNQEGPEGPAGEGGFSGHVIVTKTTAFDSVGDKSSWIPCPSGTTVIGGGAGIAGVETPDGSIVINGVGLVESFPFNDGGWGARAREFVATSDAWALQIYAICADVA